MKLEMKFTVAAQKYAKRFEFICCLKVCNKNALTFACVQTIRRVDNSASIFHRHRQPPLTPCQLNSFVFVVANCCCTLCEKY